MKLFVYGMVAILTLSMVSASFVDFSTPSVITFMKPTLVVDNPFSFSVFQATAPYIISRSSFIAKEIPPVLEEKSVEIEEGPVITNDVVVPQQFSTHIIAIGNTQFHPDKLIIRKGDTIIWKNVRDHPRLKKAIIVGPVLCGRFESEIFMPEESYQWTFEKEGKCTIVEAVGKYVSTVIVE
jgi:plastocyanin